MQIRCNNCHRPFALGKEVVNMALDAMVDANQNHYNAYCPHCRRANRISRDALMRAAPDWSPEKKEEASVTDSVE